MTDWKYWALKKGQRIEKREGKEWGNIEKDWYG